MLSESPLVEIYFSVRKSETTIPTISASGARWSGRLSRYVSSKHGSYQHVPTSKARKASKASEASEASKASEASTAS